MLHGFCEKYLNEELESYAVKLCEKLGRKRKINILLGKKEIWAASIIYVIARLNFLFDKANENYLTADTICSFYNTRKSTVGNKATQIEKACNLSIGAEGYCSKEITDSFSFYRTPEGFILPKYMIDDREIVIEIADGKDAEEIDKFVEDQQKIEQQKEVEKRERKAEINRKLSEQKRKKKIVINQMDLFDED